jgi:hypothetical protein
MLPASVLPLAKMKMALGHEALLPVSSSLRVAPDWRASSVIGSGTATGAGTAMGVAIARVVRMEMIVKTFMLLKVEVEVAIDYAGRFWMPG